jgi:glycosyl transferase family 9 (putative heptosyltransferase)
MYPGALEQMIYNQDKEVSLIRHIYPSDPTFIPIHLSGGIGDVIAARSAVNFLSSAYKAVVYSYHADAFNYFPNGTLAIKGMIPDFTWHLELNTVARFRFSNRFSGFPIPEHKALFEAQQTAFRRNTFLETIVSTHPHNDAALARHAKRANKNRESFPVYSLGLSGDEGLVPQSPAQYKPHITIHDGYDISNWIDISGRSTKQWKLEHWSELVGFIKKEYPAYKIIQLGSKTGRGIDGVDECLLNKTTLTEAFDYLRHSALHIDGDSGLVHAATAMGTKCVVLFGPTPHYFYGYPKNVNITSGHCPDACYWMKDDWMGKCPIGYSSPLCMDTILPEQVFNRVKEIL